MCFMPETPRFLLSQGKRPEAEKALRFLRGPDAPVEWECARIEVSAHETVRVVLHAGLGPPEKTTQKTPRSYEKGMSCHALLRVIEASYLCMMHNRFE